MFYTHDISLYMHLHPPKVCRFSEGKMYSYQKHFVYGIFKEPYGHGGGFLLPVTSTFFEAFCNKYMTTI